jgi:hypothetical protein
MAHAGEHLLLFVCALAAEARRIFEHERRMVTAAHGQRLRVADVHDHVLLRRAVDFVGEPADPAKRFAAVRHAGVPVPHRREVRQARMVVAAAVDDTEEAIFI